MDKRKLVKIIKWPLKNESMTAFQKCPLTEALKYFTMIIWFPFDFIIAYWNGKFEYNNLSYISFTT